MTEMLIALADLHIGDRNLLRATLENLLEQVALVVGANNPGHVDILVNGDAVEGRGVYRNQGLDNILQFGNEQVLVSSWVLKSFVDRVAGSRRTAKIHLVHGHHDHSAKENLCMQLAALLQLLEVDVQYHGREWLGGPYPGYGYILARHGYGKSSYYAASYEEIRGGWKEVIDRAIASEGKVIIRRLIFAHSHWFNMGLALTGELYADVLGGFSRPAESKLAWNANRPPGAAVYLFKDKGGEPEIVPVMPDKAIWRSELKDPDLYLDNMAFVAGTLKKISRWGRERGIIP